jgi:hypothetical protein
MVTANYYGYCISAVALLSLPPHKFVCPLHSYCKLQGIRNYEIGAISVWRFPYYFPIRYAKWNWSHLRLMVPLLFSYTLRKVKLEPSPSDGSLTIFLYVTQSEIGTISVWWFPYYFPIRYAKWNNIRCNIGSLKTLQVHLVPMLNQLGTTPWRHMGEWRYSSTTPVVKSSRYPLYTSLGGPQSRSGSCGEEEKLSLADEPVRIPTPHYSTKRKLR